MESHDCTEVKALLRQDFSRKSRLICNLKLIGFLLARH